MPQLMSEVSSERDAIYDVLTKRPEPQPENEEQPKEDSQGIKPEDSQEEPKAEKAEFVKEEQKTQDEEKTVPYGALKEEREKRKELSKRVRELEEAFRQAAEDNKKLVESLKGSSDDEPITDYEQEIMSLRKKLKVALTEIDSVKKSNERSREVSSQERLEAIARQTDSELSKAGFDGFYDLIPQVVNAMNEEGIPLEERNPDVWKRVYQETVYPKFIGKYRPKESKKEEKENAKRDASLIKTPGSPGSKKKEEEWNPKTYAQWRQSQSFV